jgi:AraC-like DNA-binding protein
LAEEAVSLLQPIMKVHLPEPYDSMSLKWREAGWRGQKHIDPTFQISFITQGNVVVTHNNMEYQLRKAHLCIMPPGQLHVFSTESGYEQLGINLCAPKDRRGIITLLETRIKTCKMLDRTDFLAVLPEIIERQKHLDILSQLKISSILDTLLLTSLEMLEGDSSFRTKMMSLLDLHLTDNLSLSEISRRLSFSQTHLERLTGKEFGCSVMELIRRMKINRACSLLINSDMSMEQVAEALGFFDQAHFTKFFKQRMNQSPLQYRKSKG